MVGAFALLSACGDDGSSNGGGGESAGGAAEGGTGGQPDGGMGQTGGSGGAPSTGGVGGIGGQGGEGGAPIPTYSIGGLVTGLAGTGLVLENNGGDDLAVDQAGPFTFATELLEGDDYDVSVLTQPTEPWQTCTVSKGAGPVGTADVIDVQVDCTTDTHTVTVDVFGVYGTGLVLENNGADDLPIPQDGSYTFSTAIPSGQNWDISVATAPTGPAETCNIDQAQGTMGGQDIHLTVLCELVDSDADHIPDLFDPFPSDPTAPAPTIAGVYAHTSSQLFTMDPVTYAVSLIGSFTGVNGQITDIAIDRYGVLYAVSFSALFVCDASTAACYQLATLPSSFNGLTVVPAGTVDPNFETIVGIANSGNWYAVNLTGTGSATVTQIGAYGNGYSSTGDAYSIVGVGTYGAVNKPGASSTVIVSVDPATGTALNEVGEVTGYTTIYGLAGWQSEIFAFNSSGAIVSIDPMTGQPTLLAQTPYSWWGAGVSTEL